MNFIPFTFSVPIPPPLHANLFNPSPSHPPTNSDSGGGEQIETTARKRGPLSIYSFYVFFPPSLFSFQIYSEHTLKRKVAFLIFFGLCKLIILLTVQSEVVCTNSILTLTVTDPPQRPPTLQTVVLHKHIAIN